MKVIFLDVDGVLNSIYSKERINHMIGIEDSKVKILKQIVDKTGAEIVLISSWKSDWDKDYDKCQPCGKYLTDKLKKQGLYIYDKINDVDLGMEELTNLNSRLIGIFSWLWLNETEQWIVIDDELPLDNTLKRKLVKTEFCDDGRTGGLQEKHIEEAVRLMGKIPTKLPIHNHKLQQQ